MADYNLLGWVLQGSATWLATVTGVLLAVCWAFSTKSGNTRQAKYAGLLAATMLGLALVMHFVTNVAGGVVVMVVSLVMGLMTLHWAWDDRDDWREVCQHLLMTSVYAVCWCKGASLVWPDHTNLSTLWGHLPVWAWFAAFVLAVVVVCHWVWHKVSHKSHAHA